MFIFLLDANHLCPFQDNDICPPQIQSAYFLIRSDFPVIFILDFLCIHPFNDGNGRMSRLLTLLLLYRSGYIVGKYISIEKLISDTKETYYEALQASSYNWHEGTNDYAPFVTYMLGILTAAYRDFQRDSYLRRENEKWFDVESVFSNALNTINLMPPLIEAMDIDVIEPKEAIKQIQRYQVNANICLDQILTSLDSADYRKVRTLSNSMERAREKFCQVMQNRAEI